MSDIVIVIQEEAPNAIVTTTEQTPVVNIPNNQNTNTLTGMTDVFTESVANGDVLTYEDGFWVNKKVTDSLIQSPLDGGEFL